MSIARKAPSPGPAETPSSPGWPMRRSAGSSKTRRDSSSRELKRGHRYDAIILDPPSYGHGPAGEIWKLEDDLPKLLAASPS